MIHWLYALIALLAGAMMPIQGAINTRLAHHVQAPLMSAFISFAVGTVALLLILLFSGHSMTAMWHARSAPPLTLTGGLLGAFFVTAVILAVPKLGMALTFSLLVLGQMLMTLPIDHTGFMGVVVKQINWTRIAGVMLIVAGVILIRKF